MTPDYRNGRWLAQLSQAYVESGRTVKECAETHGLSYSALKAHRQRYLSKGQKRKYRIRAYADVEWNPTVCEICGEEWHHAHHIVPRRFQGANYVSNLIPLCRPCHMEVERVSRRAYEGNAALKSMLEDIGKDVIRQVKESK